MYILVVNSAELSAELFASKCIRLPKEIPNPWINSVIYGNKDSVDEWQHKNESAYLPALFGADITSTIRESLGRFFLSSAAVKE
mgnify:CR=1 FL=1